MKICQRRLTGAFWRKSDPQATVATLWPDVEHFLQEEGIAPFRLDPDFLDSLNRNLSSSESGYSGYLKGRLSERDFFDLGVSLLYSRAEFIRSLKYFAHFSHHVGGPFSMNCILSFGFFSFRYLSKEGPILFDFYSQRYSPSVYCSLYNDSGRKLYARRVAQGTSTSHLQVYVRTGNDSLARKVQHFYRATRQLVAPLSQESFSYLQASEGI